MTLRHPAVTACVAVIAFSGAVAAEPRIVSSWTVPPVPLAAGVSLGGLSDLAPASGSDEARRFWAVTDRGPNGKAKVDGKKVRTLLAPGFAPALVLLRLEPGAAAQVERVVPLRGPDGAPLSGRPPGGDVLFDDRDERPVAADPRGIDSEGVAALADGTFWIAEEYGPSLVHVAADGTEVERFVPRGAAPRAAARDVLPAVYARRRENRGFEALAASADGRRLWALLQSPLEVPNRKAGARTGNVRLLVFDTAAGEPAAEHVYRLGDPAAPGYLTEGAPPDDGKLCAMAAVNASTLLVLEQDDDGLARLYAADLSAATDTLGRDDDAPPVEQVVDLAAAAIVPVRKHLVADLTTMRRRMQRDADAGTAGGEPLKLEGLAIVDERHVALVNDNDFAVPQAAAKAPPRASRLWIVELPADLSSAAAVP